MRQSQIKKLNLMLVRGLALDKHLIEVLELINKFIEKFNYCYMPQGIVSDVHLLQQKAKIKAAGKLIQVKEELRKLYSLVKRNTWNIQFATKLDAMNLTEVSKQWQTMRDYAHLLSDDIRFIAEFIFPKIETNIAVSLRGIKEQIKDKRLVENKKITNILAALQNLRQKIGQEKHKLAKAMLIRIELASEYKDEHFDDVMFHFAKILQQHPVSPEQAHFMTKRPYHEPCRGLMGNAAVYLQAKNHQKAGVTNFSYFNRYILRYGTDKIKHRYQSLSWLANQPAMIGMKWLRTIREKPYRLFKGKRALYQAFCANDIGESQQVKYMTIQFGSDATLRLLMQWKKFGIDDITYEPNLLHQRLVSINQEYQRIQKLKVSLNRFWQQKSRRILQAYMNGLLNNVAENIETQLLCLEYFIKQFTTKKISRIRLVVLYHN